MLEAIREKSPRWLVSAILLMLVVPFAFWGVNSYVQPTGNNAAAQELLDLLIEHEDRVTRPLFDACVTRGEAMAAALTAFFDLMEALRASLNKKTPAPSKASAPEVQARETRKPAKRAEQPEPVARRAARK